MPPTPRRRRRAAERVVVLEPAPVTPVADLLTLVPEADGADAAPVRIRAGMATVAAGSAHAAEDEAPWREHLAIGLLVADLSPTAVARYAGVPVATASASLATARAAGALGADGTVPDREAAALLSDLSPARAAEVHAAAARNLLGGTPQDLRRGLAHIREAGLAMPTDELAALADRAGRFALDVGDHGAARDLLSLAMEYDVGGDPHREAERRFALALAVVALGDGEGARAHLMRTVLLAEEAGDAALATRAAGRFALPADWQSGDPRAVGLLDRVMRMELSCEERTRIRATRAWLEARTPVATVGGQQVSWVTRPSVAQPLAETALADSETCTPATRLLALLAWRHTHRGPQHLERRRAVSSEALDLAQTLGAQAEQVEAAVLLAVDALEAGDRPGHRRALAIAAAAADALGGPRMRWRATVPAAAAAMFEGDTARAVELATRATELGREGGVPGLLASEWLLAGQAAIASRDPEATRRGLAVDHAPIATSAIGRPGLALLLARAGRRREAAEHARATLGMLEDEGSLLLSLSRLADVAWELGDAALAAEVLPRLAPWSGRVVVDANAWWCDGPVDLWLAAVEVLTGDTAAAGTHLDAARALAERIGDVRSRRRIDEVAERLDPSRRADAAARLGLTEREARVLALLAGGATYREIADVLAFSVSTIRNEAVAVYRKLGVDGRTEAAVRAVELGVEPEDPGLTAR